MNKFETWRKLTEPAPIIDERHNKFWYNKDMQLHRIDAPAIIWEVGGEQWLLNGILHRIDGPAITYSSGEKRWYINGNVFSEAAFNEQVRNMA